MTTVNPGVGKAYLPTFQEIRDAMRLSTGVLIAAILVGGVVAVAMLAVVGFLVYQGRDTAAILTVVNTLISSFALKSVYDLKGETRRVADNTNGTNTKLIDNLISNQGEGTPPQ